MTTERVPTTGRVLLLDAGAIIKLARGDSSVRRRLVHAVQLGFEIYVPAVVVAETVRGSGPRDAPVNIVINSTNGVRSLNESTARRAGHLLAEARSSSTADALVVAEALECRPCSLLTGDPDDLRALLGTHRGVLIEAL